MPISPENKKLYPANWKELVAQRKAEVGDKCEMCDAENHKLHPITGSRVVLTLAHLTHDPTKNKPWQLILLCQRCHNRLDKRWRAKNRKEKREKKQGGK